MFKSTVRCPYCHEDLDLAECRVVVSSGRPPRPTGRMRPITPKPVDAFMQLEDDGGPQDPGSDEEVLQPTGDMRSPEEVADSRGFRCVFDPSSPQDQERLRKGMARGLFSAGAESSNTPLLHARADRAAFPAFECNQCGRVLPDDIEIRAAATIAVLGTTGAGKTHFLATTLGMAKNDQVLAPFGVSSFRATIDTDSRFHQDYWVPVFEDRRTLEPTAASPRILEERIAAPLSFIADIHDKPFRLMFHDLPGETILDRTKRNTHLPFLRRADALIFLIDPLGFGSVRGKLPAATWQGAAAIARKHTQAHLVSAMAEELGATRASEIPVAVAITKSDLIFDAFGEIDPVFHQDEAQSDRAAQIRLTSTAVNREVLPLLESAEFGSALEAFDRRTMHLIASIGSNPESNGDGTFSRVTKFSPSRGTDPLLSILHRLSV